MYRYVSTRSPAWSGKTCNLNGPGGSGEQALDEGNLVTSDLSTDSRNFPAASAEASGGRCGVAGRQHRMERSEWSKSALLGYEERPMLVRTCISIVSVVCLGLCGCPLGTPRNHSRGIGHSNTSLSASPIDDALVFNAYGAGGSDLYLLRLRDLHVTRVAETPEYELSPRFSPDGKQLVYAAGVPGDRADHLFVRPVAGGPARQLTRADANDCYPRFSPDGSMIAFARDKTYVWGGLASNWSDRGVICVVGTDGSNERQLTADDGDDFQPEFSGDGKTIIFSTRHGRASIPVDGSVAITAIPGPSGAVLSPDRTRIAFSKGEFEPELRIYVANADNTAERLATRDMGGCYSPVFSRTGDRLYFFQTEWPNGPTGVPKYNIWEATLDGTTLRQLTDYRLFDDPLGWESTHGR